MAQIADISVGVKANTQRFKRGMKDARGELKKFRGSVKKSNSSMASFGKQMLAMGAGFIAARATIGSFTASLDRMDRAAKSARKLGLTTEALTSLHFAAGQTTTMVDKQLNMALQRFTRRLAEAAKGTGEAKSALIELGVSAVDLNKMPLEEALLAVADSFQEIENQSDRVRLAFKLFDAGGVDLVNMLQQGSGAIRELMAEADKLGITIGTEQSEAAEKANDSMDRLKKRWQGFANVLVGKAAPALADIMDLLTGAGGTDGPLAKAMDAFGYITGNIGNMATSLYITKLANLFNYSMGYVDKEVYTNTNLAINEQVKAGWRGEWTHPGQRDKRARTTIPERDEDAVARKLKKEERKREAKLLKREHNLFGSEVMGLLDLDDTLKRRHVYKSFDDFHTRPRHPLGGFGLSPAEVAKRDARVVKPMASGIREKRIDWRSKNLTGLGVGVGETSAIFGGSSEHLSASQRWRQGGQQGREQQGVDNLENIDEGVGGLMGPLNEIANNTRAGNGDRVESLLG